MRNIKHALGVLALAVLLSNCASSKIGQLAQTQILKITPSTLAVHGGKVAFEMSASLPAGSLPSGIIYSLHPVYKYQDQELKLTPLEFKAEDFADTPNNVIQKSQQFLFGYEVGMEAGELLVRGVEQNTNNGKSHYSDWTALTKGMISTSTLVQDVHHTAYADHGYNDAEELIPTEVLFSFEPGQGNLSRSELSNPNGRAFDSFIAEKNVTRTVSITGLHSPEPLELSDEGLASDRTKAIERAYRSAMKKYDYQELADAVKFILNPVVQDWGKFETILENYNGISTRQKRELGAILSSTMSFKGKAAAIQNHTSYEKILNDIYPKLRTAKVEILTVKPKKTKAEILLLAKQIANGETAFDELSLEEMLYAGTLTPSLDEKRQIYSAVTKIDQSWVAHNNLAATYLEVSSDQEANIQKALTQLEIAAKIRQSAAGHINLATVYLKQKNYEKAFENINAAEKLEPAGENKDKLLNMKAGLLSRKGDYEGALDAYKLVKNPDMESLWYNYGLLILLKNDQTSYKDARELFYEVIKKSDDKNALAYYCRAIVAARTADESALISNLQSAIKIDSSLRERALADLEFATYRAVLQTQL